MPNAQEDQGRGVCGEDGPERRPGVDVAHALAQARAPRPVAVAVRGGQAARRGEQDGHEREQPGRDPERGGGPGGGDDEAGDGRAGRERDGEADVQQLVALGERAARLERGGDRGAGEGAADDRDGAVGEREHDQDRQRRAGGQHGDRGEEGRLAEVEGRQRAPDGDLVEARGERGGDERREERRRQEQQRRGERAVGAVEDGDGERDGAEAPAQLVEGVGRRQAPEGRDAEGRYAHGMRIDKRVGGLERASVRSDTGRLS